MDREFCNDLGSRDYECKFFAMPYATPLCLCYWVMLNCTDANNGIKSIPDPFDLFDYNPDTDEITSGLLPVPSWCPIKEIRMEILQPNN